MGETRCERDERKHRENRHKPGVSFYDAQYAFPDARRVIAEDLAHSGDEPRFYRFGTNRDRTGILTVRFTYRPGCIRIIGAGDWRKGKRVYPKSGS
jgi:uncharacterized protein